MERRPLQPFWLRDWWKTLGRPDAINIPVWLVTIPPYLFAALSVTLRVDSEPDLNLLSAIGLAMLGYVIAGGILWLAARGLRRFQSTRPIVTLLVFVVFGLWVSLWNIAIAVVVFSQDASPWFGRVLSSSAFVALSMSLAALAVGSVRKHRRSQESLEEQLGLAEHLRATAQQSITDYRNGLVAEVRSVVESQLRAIHSHEAGTPQEKSQRLRRVVDDVIRPLSSSLNSPIDQPIAVDSISTKARRPTAQRQGLRFLKALVIERPFEPVASVIILMLAIVIPGATFIGASNSSAVGLISSMVLAIVLILAQRFVTPRLRKLPIGLALSLLVLIWLGFAYLSGFTSLITLELLDSAFDADFPRRVARLSFLSMVIPAIVFAVTRQWAESERALEDAVAAVSQQTASIRMRHWAERRELGKQVHSLVQAEMIATAVALNENAENSDALLLQLNQRVQAALDQSVVTDWREALESLKSVWAKSIVLDIHMDTAVMAVLDAEPTTASAVVDIVREGITNAVRAGHADHVSVTVSALPNALQVDVIDDGDGLGIEDEPGSGSKMLNEVCFTWFRENSGSGCRLHAIVMSEAVIHGTPTTFGFPTESLGENNSITTLPPS